MIATKKNKLSIVWTIEGIQSIPPPLVMLINPSNLDFTYTPLVNETRTLGGFTQEFWGEQLTSVSASGQTALFYDDNGLTNRNSRDSEAFQNFIRLVNIYKNNGKDYSTNLNTSSLRSNPNRITTFGIVVMTYSGKKHEGFFESFTIKESAIKQYNLEYDFSYKVIKTIGDLIIDSGQFIKET